MHTNYEPARLSPLTEAYYHRHITIRAAELGVPEAWLSWWTDSAIHTLTPTLGTTEAAA